MIYKIGQQRYHGVVYSETESRDIQISAETLIGKVKEKHSDWCEHLFDKKGRFIICLLISMSGFYIPGEYVIIPFTLLAVAAMNFDMVMNRSEVSLLLRGFTDHYDVSDIIKING